MTPIPRPSDVALLAAAAYAGPWRWQTPGHVRATDGEFCGYRFVSVEGTTLDGLAILRDVRFLPWWDRAGVGPAGFVHGARALADSLTFDLADDLRPTADFPAGRVALCGHSLGGSVALRLAALLASMGRPPAAVYAFDPARCGGPKMQRLLRRVPSVFACRDGNDEVPDVPWPYLLPERVERVGQPRMFWPHCHRIANIAEDLRAAGL